MKILVAGKKLELGEALQEHAEEAIQNAVNRHLGGEALEAHVTMTKTRHLFRCDISLHISKHFVVRSHAEDADAYRSVDQAIQRLDVRAGKYKARLRDRKRHNDLEMQMMPAQQYVVSAEEEDKGEDTPLVIAEMEGNIPTLSVGDAVMRMDLSDSNVMMFKNSKNGEFNVVYRREDGNIGWIDPTQNGK